MDSTEFEPVLSEEATEQPRPGTRLPRSFLWRVTIGITFLIVGITLARDALGDYVPPDAFVLQVLTLVGVMLIVSSFWGRARTLVIPGLVLALAATALNEIRMPDGGPSGTVVVQLKDGVPMKPVHLLGGDIIIDAQQLLTRPDYTIEASTKYGAIELLLPAGVQARGYMVTSIFNPRTDVVSTMANLFSFRGGRGGTYTRASPLSVDVDLKAGWGKINVVVPGRRFGEVPLSDARPWVPYFAMGCDLKRSERPTAIADPPRPRSSSFRQATDVECLSAMGGPSA